MTDRYGALAVLALSIVAIAILSWRGRRPRLGDHPRWPYTGRLCGAYSPGVPLGHPELSDGQVGAWRCSMPTGHRGQHSAALNGTIVAIWNRQPTDPPPNRRRTPHA